ncbi:hypothetical protein BDZ91DRAFT_768739 [Kalaharituber pfeilii]|nr:hypothetical protein BDZ91DRAFT_768739 [Kalaharituber pfeilii]
MPSVAGLALAALPIPGSTAATTAEGASSQYPLAPPTDAPMIPRPRLTRLGPACAPNRPLGGSSFHGAVRAEAAAAQKTRRAACWARGRGRRRSLPPDGWRLLLVAPVFLCSCAPVLLCSCALLYSCAARPLCSGALSAAGRQRTYRTAHTPSARTSVRHRQPSREASALPLASPAALAACLWLRPAFHHSA